MDKSSELTFSVSKIDDGFVPADTLWRPMTLGIGAGPNMTKIIF